MVFTRCCEEGNGTPLQYSCLENPMDGGAWWAAVHGVAKSQTWLTTDTHTLLSMYNNFISFKNHYIDGT